MEFCKAVDHFKTLPDNKLEKEARAIAAEYVGEGTPKAVSHQFHFPRWVVASLLQTLIHKNEKYCDIW